jgi:hypothetical protein
LTREPKQHYRAFWIYAGVDAALMILGTGLAIAGFGPGVVIAVLGLLFLGAIWDARPGGDCEAEDTSRSRLLSPRMSRVCSVTSLLLSWLLVPMFMCMCGHLGAESLPVVGSVAVLAWFGFFTSSRNSVPWVAIRSLAVIVSTMLCLKAIVDVLWAGHNPIL